MKKMKKLLFMAASITILMAVGCSKSGSGGSANSSSYSNFTLVANNYDSGYYNSHPNGSTTTSLAIWNSLTSINQLLVTGYADSLNKVIKTGDIAVTFNHQPVSSGTYKTATYFLNNHATALTDSTCDIILSKGNNQYSCNKIGNVVNVTVSNGIVTVNFSNISLLGENFSNNTKWSATLSGTIIEGK